MVIIWIDKNKYVPLKQALAAVAIADVGFGY
jgi:hypothetical protein